MEEARNKARMFGYSEFEQMLTTGGDDRSIILENSGANKYHIKPQPVADNNIFRGCVLCFLIIVLLCLSAPHI